MATTLELLIRAKLDATGLNQLETQLTKVTESVNKMMSGGARKFNAADFILSEGDVASVRESAAEIDVIIQDLKGRIVNAFATGGDEAVKQFETQMRRLQSLKATLEGVLPKQTFQQGDFLVSDDDVIKAIAELQKLDIAIQQFQTSSSVAFARGEKAASAYFKGMASEAISAKSQLEGALANKSILNPENFIGSDRDVGVVKGRVKEYTAAIDELNAKARSAFASGNDAIGKGFLKQADELSGMRSNLEKTIPVVEKTGDAIQNLLTNKITRFGFGLFAIQSSIQTFTSLIKGAFDQILSGAGALDRSRSFEVLLSGEGINPDAMKAKLATASQGILTLDQAMAKTIQLTKAGFPEIARNSDALLKVATNAAIVSGDVSQASVVYDKLIRGIIRGSPRLIDDADIILKLGDSNEKYAASLGKTVEQLTASEKVMATYNAVMTEGLRINELADQVDSTSAKVQKMKTDWSEFVTVLQESAAIIAVSSEEMKAGFSTPIDLETIAGSGEKINEVFDKMFSSLKGWGAFIGITLALVKEGIVGLAKSGYNQLRTLGLGFQYSAKTAELFGVSLLQAARRMAGMGKEADQLDSVMVNLNADLQELSKQGNAAMKGIFDTGAVDKFKSDADQILEAAGIITGKDRVGFAPGTGGEGAEGEAVTQAATNTNEDLQKILQERAKMSADIEHERTTKIRDINQDHADKMADIARKLKDTLQDISQDLNDKLLDLARDKADKLADVETDLADKLADIDGDLAEKLADITEDNSEKRQDAIDDYNKKKEDAEREHQKKINDILRQYESSRLQALIDRDARGLFEAEKKRDEDLKDAEESAVEKRQSEIDELNEKLADIAEAEAKAREDAIKRAEEQRQDAIKAAEDKRRDAQAAYDQARRDALLDAERKRRDAKEAAERQRRDEIANQQEARQDLQNWYADKKRDLANYHSEELQAYANQHNTIGQMTSSFYENQLSMASSFSGGLSDIINNSVWVGVGGNTDPTTGEEFPDYHNPANVYAGGRCNAGMSQLVTGADGRQYRCIGMTWQLFTGVGVSTTGGVGVATSPVGSGLIATNSFGGSARTVKLILDGGNDNALNTIIKSGAYEAFLEVIE